MTTPATPFWLSAFLDLVPDEHAQAAAFWQAVTGYTTSEPRDEQDEFSRLERDEPLPIQLLLQRLEEPTGRVRAHLDVATTDRAAETARHEALGASVLDTNDRGWTVLRPPAGPAYCLTDRTP